MRRETLAQRIARLREAKGWTQTELARQVGQKSQAINMLEAGTRSNPTVATVKALADAFGLTVPQFFDGVTL